MCDFIYGDFFNKVLYNDTKPIKQVFYIALFVQAWANENIHFYAAEQNNIICGYLKVNFGIAQTELQDPSEVEIQRIYVLVINQLFPPKKKTIYL